MLALTAPRLALSYSQPTLVRGKELVQLAASPSGRETESFALQENDVQLTCEFTQFSLI